MDVLKEDVGQTGYCLEKPCYELIRSISNFFGSREQ